MFLVSYPAAALLAIAMLVVWKESYDSFCPSLLIPIVITVILTLSLREFGHLQRVCRANCFFQPGSFFHRWLHGQIFITVYSLFIAIILAASLSLSVLTWSNEVLLLLAIDGLLICLTYPLILRYGVSKFGIKPGMDRVIGKRWLVMLHAPLLILAMVKVQLYAPPPAYLDTTSLAVTVSKASADKMSSCAIIDVPARLQAEKEAVLWWMMVRGSKYLGPGSTLSWVAWLGFLLNGALGAWAYARLCAQLADFARGKP